jgi:large subunit ribosomal protein L29
MKLGEMRSMALSDAMEQLAQLRAELAKERAVVAGGTRPENPGKIRQLRKTIARMLTIMRERELKGEKMPAAPAAKEAAAADAKQQPAGTERKGLLHRVIKRKPAEKAGKEKHAKAAKEAEKKGEAKKGKK